VPLCSSTSPKRHRLSRHRRAPDGPRPPPPDGGAELALRPRQPVRVYRASEIKLAAIKTTNDPLYRAYLLKEQLRAFYRVPTEHAKEMLDAWLGWARRSRLQSFVKLARTITQQQARIIAAIQHGLSNARVEAINTQIRMLTRRAFGFHTPKP
jgi:transposase